MTDYWRILKYPENYWLSGRSLNILISGQNVFFSPDPLEPNLSSAADVQVKME